MTSRRSRSLLELAALVGLQLVACGKSDKPGDVAAGTRLAESMIEAAKASSDVRAPYRCARTSVDQPQPVYPERVGRWRLRWQDDRLELAAVGKARPRSTTLGVVADARGTSPETLAVVADVRAKFEERGVDLVISLGGLAETAQEIDALLSLVARDAPWLVVAIPGDREAIGEHQAAVADLASRGLPVVDGSRVRTITSPHVAIGTFPGVAHGKRLIAGDEGCVHTPGDADDHARRLAGSDLVRVWASYAPPRQSGPAATDLTRDGIHVGEQLLAEPVRSSGAGLVLHAAVDDVAIAPSRNKYTLGDQPLYLASGALEALPVAGRNDLAGAALVVIVRPGQARWQRIVFPPVPADI